LKITETQNVSSDGGLYIGVDIGGTKVAAGIVNHKGEIRRQTKAPMTTQGTAAEGLKAVLDRSVLFSMEIPA